MSGEIDPRDPHNRIIQHIDLGRDADGKVRYVATFVITWPIDTRKASGMLWHDVPNSGRPVLLDATERAFGDIGLAGAWQGDARHERHARHDRAHGHESRRESLAPGACRSV